MNKESTDMDMNKRIEMLLKRRSDLLKKAADRSIIIEDMAPYGSEISSLEMEIQEIESALNSKIQVLWEVGIGKQQVLKPSLLNELGFMKIGFSAN